ncbi:hypothetical protein [Paenibacillus sp. GYB003]|uniref:hypothetical protein n=1 Tax=Paenibacillus sp. GYB003 TaxID=2994392 RepID=UPI002F96AAFC
MENGRFSRNKRRGVRYVSEAAWGGNVIDRNGKLVWIDWESAIIAPTVCDLFSYKGTEYAAFRLNLSQWLHDLLHENFGARQKQNDPEMVEFHCPDRWASIEADIEQLFRKKT